MGEAGGNRAEGEETVWARIRELQNTERIRASTNTMNEQSRLPSSLERLPSRVLEVRYRSIIHNESDPIAQSNGRNIGTLSKDLSHLAVNFSHPQKNVIGIEIHHGSRKNVATLRTVRTLINNLIVGVTKGFKYKMRYVYAHFPINVNLEKNNETGLWEVEIR